MPLSTLNEYKVVASIIIPRTTVESVSVIRMSTFLINSGSEAQINVFTRSLLFTLKFSFATDYPQIQIVNSIRTPPLFSDGVGEGRIISWFRSEDVQGVPLTNRWIMDTVNWSACRVVASRLQAGNCIVVGNALISVAHPNDTPLLSPDPLPPQELRIFQLPPFIDLHGLEDGLQPFDLLPAIPLLPVSTRTIDQFFREADLGHLLPLGTSSFLFAGEKISLNGPAWAPPTPAQIFDLDFSSSSLAASPKGTTQSLLQGIGLSNPILACLRQHSPNFYHHEYATNFRRFAWWDQGTHHLTLATLQYGCPSARRLTFKSQSRNDCNLLDAEPWVPPTVDCITGRSVHVRPLREAYPGRIKYNTKIIEVFDIVESRTSFSTSEWKWLFACFQWFFIYFRWFFVHFGL
ncbi:hypothetical protein DL96DRAFT_1608241 [Flagelloscypha sp. PMI_526]|nr:hypothetical protein DL96DRAFT_1608241 [Flagelloscypha sp. PMI_526]